MNDTNNNFHPLPSHAYARDNDQAEYFFEEARHLLMLAADKLTAAGTPGQEHHELHVCTPTGDVALFTIDYAHDDCDIDVDNLDRIVGQMINTRGHEQTLEILDDIFAAVEDEFETIEAGHDDEWGDFFEWGDYPEPGPMPEVAGDGGFAEPWPDERYTITPAGEAALMERPVQAYADELQMDEVQMVVAFINALLTAGGDEPLNHEEAQYLTGNTHVLPGL